MLHKRLRENGVNFIFNAQVKKITEDSVVIEIEGEEKVLAPVDQVIIAVGLRPRNDLQDFVKKEGYRYFVVGDALQPRRLIEATEEGAKAAWSL